MGRTGWSLNRFIEPANGLLEVFERIGRLVFEQIAEGDRRLLSSTSLAIGLETMPVTRGNGETLSQNLGKFKRREFSHSFISVRRLEGRRRGKHEGFLTAPDAATLENSEY
jgi:hypothetical protein